MRKRLQRALRFTCDPGNLSFANSKVSIIFLLSILSLPIKKSSLFKCAKSNYALCIINFLSFIKFKKLSHTSKNFFWVARNSSLYP